MSSLRALSALLMQLTVEQGLSGRELLRCQCAKNCIICNWAVLGDRCGAGLTAACKKPHDHLTARNTLPHLVGRLPCRLTLAAADLANMANKQYELQVLVVNYLGASSTASAKFDKVSAGQAPVISVAGGTEQTFKISEGIKLTAQLQATSVCAGKKVRGRSILEF